MTRLRVKRDERTVCGVVTGQSRHALAHGLLGQCLQAGVERGVDAQALALLVPVQCLRPVRRLQRLPHVDDKVRGGGEVQPGGLELIVAHLGSRQRSLGVADITRLDHQCQDILLARESQVEPAAERIVGGR